MQKTIVKQKTSVKTNDDLSYENLINIYKMLIPDEIEESYVKMTSIIEKYIGVHRNSKDWTSFKKKISALVSKRNEHVQTEKELQEKIAELTKKGPEDPRVYDEIILLTEQAKKEHIEAKKAERQIEDLKKSFSDDSKETVIDTKAYVGEIKELLETIKAQNFDVENLDLETYLNIIDSFNIDDKQKELLKNTLSSYVSLRTSIFAKMEKLAQLIIDSYEKLTYLDLNMLTAENETYLIALTAGDINIGEILQESGLRSISSNPLYVEKENNQALTMKIVSDYINNGILDKNQVAELQSTSMDYEYKNILSILQNARSIEDDNTMEDESISEGRSR